MERLANINGVELFESQEEILLAQQSAWRYTFALAYPLAMKCAVELQIPDMIAAHGPKGTLSLQQIATKLPAESPNMELLRRIMNYLVDGNFFSAVRGQEDGQLRYGLTPISKWMVKDDGAMLMFAEDYMISQWYPLKECILEGGIPFEKSHGMDLWKYLSLHPEHKARFQHIMTHNTYIDVKALLSSYDGFENVSSLVDVGGGSSGTAIVEIVKAHPNIATAINFDLADVLADAPPCPGIQHVGGDMFVSVPQAEVVFMKWILHDWSDEECVIILKNCIKAIPKSTGKVIIMDMVLEESSNINKGKGEPTIPSMGAVMDLAMMAYCNGGKERNKSEWERSLPTLDSLHSSSLPLRPCFHSLKLFHDQENISEGFIFI